MSDHRILIIGDDSSAFDRLRDLLAEAVAEGTIRTLHAVPADGQLKPCRVPRLNRRLAANGY